MRQHAIVLSILAIGASASAQPAAPPGPAASNAAPTSSSNASPSASSNVAASGETNAGSGTPSTPTEPAGTSGDTRAREGAVVATVVDAAAIETIVDRRVEARLAKEKPTAGWKDGFYIQTADGASKLRIGGYTQFDGKFFVADSSDPHTDQFGFRSIRPELAGTVFEHFDFRFLPDFAGAKLAVQDVYVDVRYTDVVKVRFGKFKVPFGLERLQSEVATTFVERGLPTLLTPNRDLGVQIFGELAGGVLAYQVGVFNGVPDGASGDGDASDAKEYAARVFVKPFAGGASLAKDFGIGGAVTYGNKEGNLASPDVPRYTTQGGNTFFAYKAGTSLMDTVVEGGRQVRATAQADWFAGPVGVLAEYVRSIQRVKLDGNETRVVADAWQVVGQWVVTGDDASYKSVTPKRPFDPSKGQWGAVDVAARIGELRLADDLAFQNGVADPTKSSLKAWSAGGGVDWFPNKNFRFVVDLERTWYRLGAKNDTGAIDRPAETSIIGRVQTVF